MKSKPKKILPFNLLKEIINIFVLNEFDMNFNIRKASFLSIIFTFFHIFLTAQNKTHLPKTETTRYDIQRVGQFSSAGKNNNTFWQILGNIVFGTDPQNLNLVKPISVTAQTPDLLFVLDRGINSLSIINNRRIIVAKPEKGMNYRLSSPVDICHYKKGFLLFTDSELNKIFIFDMKREKYNVLYDSLELNQPTGIDYEPKTKTTWVVETGAHRISVIDEQGKIIRQIGKRGTEAGEFNFPVDIQIDNKKTVYVVDALNYRIQIFDSLGNHISSFGEAGNATGFFARPKSVATDSFGNIYVTDALSNIIQVFNNKGELLYYFGSKGRKKNQFLMPTGIYIDENNYIYIADSYNARIQIFKIKTL